MVVACAAIAFAAHRLPFECWATASARCAERHLPRSDYSLTASRSPIDTSTRESQHWVHPPTATLGELRRASSAPPMQAKDISYVNADTSNVFLRTPER